MAHPHRTVKPERYEQLPMFMKPLDIMQNYAVHDYERLETAPSDSDLSLSSDPDGWDDMRPETDDELWDRKADEAQYDKRVYDPVMQQETSLYDSIRSGQGIHTPIQLIHDANTGQKRVIGNGYHRLASALDGIPMDDYIPVEHSDRKNPTTEQKTL